MGGACPLMGADSMDSEWQRQTCMWTAKLTAGSPAENSGLLLPQDEDISQSTADSRKGGSNPGLSCPRVAQ